MKQWDNYWQNQAVAAVNEPQLQRALARFWRQRTQHFDKVIYAVDVASGHGDVIRHIDRPQWHWAATDLASIPAQQHAITLAGIDAAQQPFSSGQFDLVVSQFGLEYADVAAALQEALRIGRPNATILALLHHTDSIISQQARIDVMDVQHFANSKVASLIEALIEEMGVVVTEADFAALEQRHSLQALGQQLDVALSALRKQISAGLFRLVLAGIERVLNEQMAQPVSVRLELWRAGVQDLQLFRERNQHQLSAALTAADLQRICHGLSADNLHIEHGLLQSEEGLVAHWLQLTKIEPKHL
ncbi:class I SAM-dependent methyltransferase [uncultured Ferrimonas sp.]|uniref:class I SAM-dependent methyltransferase n=1 Tax=uncultured Ferrimonas sp. TaxID=432640 RepID=UPI0026367E31|nr:class I SAM-dependent methyltransferase [uncultured Ferrimonas sp.]